MLSFHYRRLVLAVLDALIINLSMIAALVLTSNGDISPATWVLLKHTTLWLTPLIVLCCLAGGLYHRIWEFARVEAALGIIAGITTGNFLALLVMIAAPDVRLPWDTLALSWLLSMLLIGSSRFGWREVRRRWAAAAAGDVRRPIVLYGDGSVDGNLATRIDYDPASPYKVIGYVVDDDRRSMVGLKAAGYRVLGTVARLDKLVEQYGFQDIMIAGGMVQLDKYKRIIGVCRRLRLNVLRPQPPLEIVGDTSIGRSIRSVRNDDIIGHGKRELDVNLQADYVAGKCVLVTGAGGSIGSEICRQLCRYGPRKIILFGRGENRIHEIYQEFKTRFPNIEFVLAICNFVIPEATAEVFELHRPEVVFHTGAHKHVYLMEQNPVEAVRNNIFGTKIVADIAESTGVDKLVFISTDKAVEPTTVMGATKRFCEEMLLARNSGKPNGKRHHTEFIVVRFGNVIGSAGSVLTIFEKQLQLGQPLTVTDPQVDRFFMTIQEAAFLVLQAGALSNGGDLYVLDMGEPRKIIDIAREFIELHGGNPDAPGAISIIGLSPGEKLHESLTNPGERLCSTDCSLVNQVCLRPNMATQMEIDARLQRLQWLCARHDAEGIRQLLELSGEVLEPLPLPNVAAS